MQTKMQTETQADTPTQIDTIRTSQPPNANPVDEPSRNGRPVGTLTNSPGCVPAAGAPAIVALSRAQLLDLFAPSLVASATASDREVATASTPRTAPPRTPPGTPPGTPPATPPATPQTAAPATPLRRHHADARPAVRTDAWATPASVSWTRTRKTIRNVSRRPQSTDWALPY